MILLDVVGDVARTCCRQHEHRIDDEDTDPLDADGDNDGQHRREGTLDPERLDAAAARERGIDGQHEQLVENQGPGDDARRRWPELRGPRA